MGQNPGIDIEQDDDRVVIAERRKRELEKQVEKGLSEGAYRAGQRAQIANLTAEGFSFFSKEEAEEAVRERKKIDYLEKHIDYKKPEKVHAIYEKAIEDKVFRTPVGMVYLYKLREILIRSRAVPNDTISPIPLYSGYEENVRAERARREREQRREKSQAAGRKAGYTISLILNAILLVAVAAMFCITLYAEQPNILNYERALTNRYASWAQELSEREQAVRAKERELFGEEP